VSFDIYPLSFKEFQHFRKIIGIKDTSIQSYIKQGGFPIVSTGDYSNDRANKLVFDIHTSAVLKDVIERHKIKNVPLLKRIISFLYDNTGNLISITKITNYMKSNKEGGDFDTINAYIGYLENACIIRKAQRYEIKGKKLLESNDKYFLADHSLQYAVRGFNEANISGILENIVYNELSRRGYTVYVGKMSKDDNREIDFIAEKTGGEKVYVQVCLEYSLKETMQREFAPLTEIKDHYPKYVVVLNALGKANVNGVIGITLEDFLLKNEF
jgi:predicted AAA+ superfamily ATPase